MYLTISVQSLIALKIELKIKLKSYSIKPVQSSLVTYTLPVMVIHLVLLREHSPSFIHRSAATDTQAETGDSLLSHLKPILTSPNHILLTEYERTPYC